MKAILPKVRQLPLSNIDEIIRLIKESANAPEAKENCCPAHGAAAG